MRLSTLAAILSAAVASVAAIELPAGVPRSLSEFREKHPYRLRKRHDRKVVTLRASRNSTDDVSRDFLRGIHKANHGGTLYLPANQTFVIGQPLDLTFLDDVHVHLDGEIKFTDDTPYWQSVAFTHPFQNTIMFWKWGGRDIKIYGTGSLDGNGQRWWNEFAGLEILDPDNAYLRPVLFYAQNATNLDIEGIHFKDSPCWTNFIVTCKRRVDLMELVTEGTCTDPRDSKGGFLQGRSLHRRVEQRHGVAQEYRLLRLPERRARCG